VIAHEPEPFVGLVFVSRANQAAAFERISRSSLSWRFSRRNRLSSSRSAVVRPPSLRPELRSDWASQFLIDCAVGSNSRASSSGERPALHQFHHLPAELGCVGQSCLGHRGLLERKRSGVHETGSTSGTTAMRTWSKNVPLASSCLSSLHLFKSWSLRQTRSGSYKQYERPVTYRWLR
jgi:hypothetical protein